MPAFTASNSVDTYGSHVITGGLTVGSTTEQNYGVKIVPSLASTAAGTSLTISAQNLSFIAGLTISAATSSITSAITTGLTVTAIHTNSIQPMSVSSAVGSVTLSNASSLEIAGVPTLAGTVGNFATFSNAYGLKIGASSTIAATAYGAYIDAPTGTGTRWSLYIASGNSYFSTNVGIGIVAGSALDVKGTLRLSGSTSGYVGFAPAAAAGSTTYTLPSADGASGYVLQTNGGGILSWVASSGGGGASLSVANTWTATQTFSGGLTISAATTDVYATLTNTASGGRSWIINATSTSSGEGGGRLLFKDATASATRMTIDSAGNVGIGTSSPVAGDKLTITGGRFRFNTDSAYNAPIIMSNDTGVSDNLIIKMYSPQGVNSFAPWYIRAGVAGVDGAAFAIQTGAAANIGSETVSTKLFINTAGNVGIGTSTPGSTLDVKGTLRLSGSTSGYVEFAPAAAAGSTTYTLPSADGASSQVLQTSGGGILSWATPRRVYSIPASAFTVTATTPATLQAVGTSNASSGQSNVSGGAFYELSFSDTSTSTSADVVLRASAHRLDGNQTMSVKLVWYSTATTNAVRWAWDIYSGTTSNVVNGALALIAATTATVNSTTLRHNITTLTTLAGSNVPLEDSLVTLRISRLGADGADTLIGTANVIAVYVEFT